MTTIQDHDRQNASATDKNPLSSDAALQSASEEGPSKSAVKRAMSELQKLGESLLNVKPETLDNFDLSDTLLDALATAKKIKSREGRRRQLQFIGKLMRKEPDEKVTAIRQFFDSDKLKHQQSVDQHKAIENWREKLLADGDQALHAFISEFPNTDRTQLRQLVRASLLEQKKQKPPANFRKLFQYIKDVTER